MKPILGASAVDVIEVERRLLSNTTSGGGEFRVPALKLSFACRAAAEAAMETIKSNKASVLLPAGTREEWQIVESTFDLPLPVYIRDRLGLGILGSSNTSSSSSLCVAAMHYSTDKVSVVGAVGAERVFACSSQEEEGEKEERRMLQRVVAELVQLDPDCLVASTSQQWVSFWQRCVDLGVPNAATLLSRIPGIECALNTVDGGVVAVFDVPGRIVVDLRNLSNLLQEDEEGAASVVGSSWQCYHAFTQLGGVNALQRALRGLRFPDALQQQHRDPVLPTTTTLLPSSSSKRMKKTSPPPVSTSPPPPPLFHPLLPLLSATPPPPASAAASTTNHQLVHALSKLPPAEIATLAQACSSSTKCLTRLNQLLVECNRLDLVAAANSPVLLRPSLLQLKVRDFNTRPSPDVLLRLLTTTGDSFLQSLAENWFIEWIAGGEGGGRDPSSNTCRAHFPVVLQRLPSADLKRLLMKAPQVGPTRLQPVFDRFQEDWLDSPHGVALVCGSFEALLLLSSSSSSSNSLPARLFGLLRQQQQDPALDVFEATCPRRLRRRLGDWRAAGEAVVRRRRQNSSTTTSLQLPDNGYSLWSKLVLGTELCGANTLGFAIGFLFPTANVAAASPYGEDIVAASFLASLVTAVFDARFTQDVRAFAFLVQHTVSANTSAQLQPAAQQQLAELHKLVPTGSSTSGHPLLLAIALHLLNGGGGEDVLALRQELYVLANVSAAEIGCALTTQLAQLPLQSVPASTTTLSKEEERLILKHFADTPQGSNCASCGTGADVLFLVHQLSQNQSSHFPLQLLAKKLEQGTPLAVHRLQMLGRNVCAALATAPSSSTAVVSHQVINLYIRILGAISFYDGGRIIIFEHLDWPTFTTAACLAHANPVIRDNSFVLLHEVCTRIQPPADAAAGAHQPSSSCFVIKREDAMLFQVERMHGLCRRLLDQIVVQYHQGGDDVSVVWESAAPTCSALMELYSLYKTADQGRMEIAQGVIGLLMWLLARGDHQGCAPEHRPQLARLVVAAMRNTPLLHALKQLPTRTQLLPVLYLQLEISGAAPLVDQPTWERLRGALS